MLMAYKYMKLQKRCLKVLFVLWMSHCRSSTGCRTTKTETNRTKWSKDVEEEVHLMPVSAAGAAAGCCCCLAPAAVTHDGAAASQASSIGGGAPCEECHSQTAIVCRCSCFLYFIRTIWMLPR